MQKIRFFISLFVVVGMAPVFILFGANASNAQTYNVDTVDMVQTDKYMYMSEPNEGVVYVFDNQNDGAFVKKIIITDASGPLNMLVYRTGTTVAYMNYILIAHSDGHFISIIDEFCDGAGLCLNGHIQTGKKPYDIELSNGYLLVSVSEADEGGNYLPFSIQLSEGANGMPYRTPGTADYQWQQSDVANMVFMGNEKLHFSLPNNQLFIFGTDPVNIAFQSLTVLNGVPTWSSSPFADEYSNTYNDLVFDHDWWHAFYVGDDGVNNGKVQVIEVGSNDKLYEWEVPDGLNTNSVAFGSNQDLYVGMDAPDGADLIKYEISYSSSNTIPAETIKTRFLLGDSGRLLSNGISSEMNGVDANYAVTEEYVFWLVDNGTSFSVYSFLEPSEEESDFSNISNFNVRNITDSSADICWEYDYPATTFYLQWGESETALGGSNSQVEINDHSYCYTIEGLNPLSPSGLSPSTTYFAHVKSYSDSIPSTSYLAISDVISFTTLADSTTNPPGSVTPESKADLIVSEIFFESDNNRAKEIGTLTVIVKNIGGPLVNSDPIALWYYGYDFGNLTPALPGVTLSSTFSLGGDSFPTLSNPMENGDELYLSWAGFFPESGDHLIYFKVDGSNILEEVDETNNELRTFINISDAVEGVVDNGLLPDLIVSSISFVSEKNEINQIGSLSVTIRNDGVNLTSSEGIRYVTNDADFGSFISPNSSLSAYEVSRILPSIKYPLVTGDNITFIWKGKFTNFGEQLVSYNVDSQNKEKEVNENNNVTEVGIDIAEPGETLKYPDLQFVKVEKLESSDGGIDFNIYYQNAGEAQISESEFFIGVVVDNSPYNDMVTLVNDSNNVIMQVVKADNSLHLNLEPGEHFVRFTLDSFPGVTEKDEGNNVYTKKFYIADPILSPNEVEDVEKLIRMKQAARDLINQNLNVILYQIKELRDVIREQNHRLKYLGNLSSAVSLLTNRMQDALNSFVTYGVDYNTKALGAGERAAVIYSYKDAYNKLPETEEELADAIRIANGRWPGITNKEAEDEAKEKFIEIYSRIPNMDSSSDNAAVTVMAYGLRQSAENRNLNSEKVGISTFMSIYGYHPVTTQDWNMMQAITYSGATRSPDSDGDFLTDEREEFYGTDPSNSDSDGDGFVDGLEVLHGYDPLSPTTN